MFFRLDVNLFWQNLRVGWGESLGLYLDAFYV